MKRGPFLDRRQNPSNRSLGDRQKFMRRAKAIIRRAIDQAIGEGNIADIGEEGVTVPIPPKSLGEPKLRHDRRVGSRSRVLPGNKEFVTGDEVKKPQKGGSGAGKDGSPDGEGEDEFWFTLSREEFLEFYLEDLELPDLVKTDLKKAETVTYKRAGFARDGTPSNMDVMRTMRNSLGRRIALNRPDKRAIEELEAEIALLVEKVEPKSDDEAILTALREELKELKRRQKIVGYIDPVDVRFRQRTPVPEPTTSAVMFCLMDVSGSMGEREKDLAKRFFILLHLFLKRNYEKVDIVFIRHTHEAKEVDEETFFHSRESGGTIVSTALEKMLEVVHDRYPTDSWNIYVAQASDGENFSGDSKTCSRLLAEKVLQLCQYYAYVEILDEGEVELLGNPDRGAALWRSYLEVAESMANLAMKRVSKPADIYPVFRELFLKATKKA